MKLNYRDKVILIVLLGVVLVVCGIALGIRPTVNNIKDDKAKYEDRKAEWEEIETKINQIKPLQKEIQEIHAKSKTLAADFVDVTRIDTPQELDQFMQPYVDKCNIVVRTLNAGNVTISPIRYYYFKPSILTSSMFDAADVNGEFEKTLDEVQKESNALSERTEEKIMRTQYGIVANGTREEIWAFMDEINNINSTVIINSVSIADYTFGAQEEGATPLSPEEVDKSDVTIVISLYSIDQMDAPVVE